MLLGLLLAISLGNIALAFHTTLLFRRDCVLRRRPDSGAAARLPVEMPAREEALLREEPQATEIVLCPSPLTVGMEPRRPQPVEDLYFHAVRLGEFLARIDHSVVSGRAGELSTEEQLANVWPQLAQKAEPIAKVLLEARAPAAESPDQERPTELLARLQATGNAILDQCRSLADEMDTPEKRLSNADSGMHHLRDLFHLACEFRDQCEDVLAEEGGIDPPTQADSGRIALQRKAAELVETCGTGPACVVGFEVDHVAELNGMYGATIVNALLGELGRMIATSLSERGWISRYHAQHYLVLATGDAEGIAAWADAVRQQFAATRFRGENHLVEATLSGVVLPLTSEPKMIVSRLLTALSESKQWGHNRIVSGMGESLVAVATAEANLVPVEVPLQLQDHTV